MKQFLLLLIISGHLYGQDTAVMEGMLRADSVYHTTWIGGDDPCRQKGWPHWIDPRLRQLLDSINNRQDTAHSMGERRPDTLYYKWNRRDSVTLYNREDTFGLSCPDTIPWKPYFRKHKVKRAAWFKTFPVKEWFPDQRKTEYGIIQHQTPVDTNTTYLKSELKQRQITDTGHREPFQWRGILPPSDPWYSGDHWWKWLGFWIGALTVFFTLVIILGVWIIKDHPFDHREEEMREENLQQ